MDPEKTNDQSHSSQDLKGNDLIINHQREDGHQPSTPTPRNMLPDVPFHLLNFDGFIQTLEFVPTYTPSRFIDQFVIVTSGGSSRAYIYDTKPTGGKAWRYTTLT